MDFLINNWWYILLVGAFAFMMFRGGGCCGGHSHGGHDHTGHDQSGHTNGRDQNNFEKMNSQVNMACDPVCGMYVNPDTAIKEVVDGKSYYFCSESCRTEFLKKKVVNL